jgi:hypothetical protein
LDSKFQDKDFDKANENPTGATMATSEDADMEEPIAHEKEPETKTKKSKK